MEGKNVDGKKKHQEEKMLKQKKRQQLKSKNKKNEWLKHCKERNKRGT